MSIAGTFLILTIGIAAAALAGWLLGRSSLNLLRGELARERAVHDECCRADLSGWPRPEHGGPSREASARHHEWQPGGWQLQFCGVDRLIGGGIPNGIVDSVRLQSGRDAIERVTRGNL